MGRTAEPEEIARAALFLAQEGSSYITGETVHVNGGWLMRQETKGDWKAGGNQLSGLHLARAETGSRQRKGQRLGEIDGYAGLNSSSFLTTTILLIDTDCCRRGRC